jgi:uncharacterized protein (DUF1810 family)
MARGLGLDYDPAACRRKRRRARPDSSDMSKSSTEPDPFDLDRFVRAQAGVYAQACDELRAGRKQTHWMWFVFPQIRGLGFSPTSQHYGIGSLAEARAYLAHPVLGPRLEAATRLVLAQDGRRLGDVLGSPDDLKFRSSMTLFARAAAPGSVFDQAIAALCAGTWDEKKEALLREP